MSDSMRFQREENDGEILIFVVDESYGYEGNYVDTSQYDDEFGFVTAASKKYRESIEAEFNVEFEEVNIGPGADIPAFATVVSSHIVPLIPWLLAVFFSGKPIIENFAAWRTVFNKLKPYFSRTIVLNRHGAAVIAVEAVFEDMGGLVKTLRLVSYRTGYRVSDEEYLAEAQKQIDDAPPTLNLSMLTHIFEIEADGVRFMVAIDGRKPTVRRL
jgi:hypothetical protein